MNKTERNLLKVLNAKMENNRHLSNAEWVSLTPEKRVITQKQYHDYASALQTAIWLIEDKKYLKEIANIFNLELE